MLKIAEWHYQHHRGIAYVGNCVLQIFYNETFKPWYWTVHRRDTWGILTQGVAGTKPEAMAKAEMAANRFIGRIQS